MGERDERASVPDEPAEPPRDPPQHGLLRRDVEVDQDRGADRHDAEGREGQRRLGAAGLPITGRATGERTEEREEKPPVGGQDAETAGQEPAEARGEKVMASESVVHRTFIRALSAVFRRARIRARG